MKFSKNFINKVAKRVAKNGSEIDDYRCLVLKHTEYTIITKNHCLFKFPDTRFVKIKQDDETSLRYCPLCSNLLLIRNE